MGNALVNNWNDTQHTLYGLQSKSSYSVSIALGTVLTQYCVAEWIQKSRSEENHKSPVFLVSPCSFWIIWTLAYNFQVINFIPLEADTKGYYIAIPTIALGGFLLNLTFSYGWQHAMNRGVSSDHDVGTTMSSTHTTPLLEDKNALAQPTSDLEAQQALPKEAPVKVTLDYINNIKIFLTNMVILLHCAAEFGGLWPGLANMTRDNHTWGNIILGMFMDLNSSYFMNLFFFYSGFFVPKSFDKKGVHDFLFDRVKRLGIPYVIYTYFLGPYVYGGFMHLFFQTQFPSTPANYGPTWFLNQLMIFSIMYALACGKNWSPKVECPSLAKFFLIGSIVGLFSGILMLFFPTDDDYFGVPHFWQDYLSYPVYFFGGAIAQRNGWMESVKEKSRVAIYSWMLLIVFVTFLIKAPFADKVNFVVFQLFWGIMWKGVLSVALSLAVSVFFMDYVNKKYFCTEFFSKAMYTAYIIQYAFPMLVGLKCLLLILDSTGNLAFEDPSNPILDSAYIVNSNLLFPGWLLVAAITLIINWPLAYAIRSIPGFSQVL